MAINDSADGSYIKKSVETISHNEFENADDSDINNYVSYKILEQLIDIKKIMLNSRNNREVLEYSVVELTDTGDSTDIYHLADILNKYADMGWRVSNIFVNEKYRSKYFVDRPLKDEYSVDQVVIVFERYKKNN
ncbi:MAG: DUF4177 domain-containing protein [Clostridia bacterium]|nr:DUF4177 domain-containing protein [Clostridia bacterium]